MMLCPAFPLKPVSVSPHKEAQRSFALALGVQCSDDAHAIQDFPFQLQRTPRKDAVPHPIGAWPAAASDAFIHRSSFTERMTAGVRLQRGGFAAERNTGARQGSARFSSSACSSARQPEHTQTHNE